MATFGQSYFEVRAGVELVDLPAGPLHRGSRLECGEKRDTRNPVHESRFGDSERIRRIVARGTTLGRLCP